MYTAGLVCFFLASQVGSCGSETSAKYFQPSGFTYGMKPWDGMEPGHVVETGQSDKARSRLNQFIDMGHEHEKAVLA